jgi:hypothetical protein
MATNPIYVETEEEVPEVVERLRRFNGEDTMLVLPIRSRVGQSRFNFQLLRNYASRMGKRVTVVCDDPAVQKMASESGFAVFGAVGVHGEGIPSEPEALPRPRRWWERGRTAPVTHIGIAAPTKLITKSATELKPGRFLLYVAAATLLVVGLFAIIVYVPSASVTLVAQAQSYSQKAVECGRPSSRAPTRKASRRRVSSRSSWRPHSGPSSTPTTSRNRRAPGQGARRQAWSCSEANAWTTHRTASCLRKRPTPIRAVSWCHGQGQTDPARRKRM